MSDTQSIAPNQIVGTAILTSDQAALLNGVSLPIMVVDRDLRFVYANAPYLEATHTQLSDLIGRNIFDCFPDTTERIAAVREQFDQTLKNGVTTQLDAQPFKLERQDGSIADVVWQATQDPIRDEKGHVIGMIQRAEDITLRHELRQQNQAIAFELNHRVKNTLAVVSSIARLTSRGAVSVPEFVSQFVDRLKSLAKANTMLAQDDWRGLTVRRILEEELKAFARLDGDTLALTGPDVRLSLEATKDLCMVTHELATNAAKYGALSDRGGTLSIGWQREDNVLDLKWVEHCRTPITKPDGTIGFGTRLLDMLPYIDAKKDFHDHGLQMTITVSGEKAFA